MAGTVSPAHARMIELVLGARVALALRVAAERRIADLLADEAKTAEALSAASGLPAGTLRRLLRGLAALGVFAESPAGEFSNTETSACMREEASPSVRDMILVLNDDAALKAWQRLSGVLESGAPAFAAVNGMTFFEYIAADPQRSERMGRYMTRIYGPEAAKIAAGYPFERFRSLIDVGGSQGHVLVEILRRHPGVRGALFELPPTAEIARRFLSAQGFAHCEVFAGDFFAAVPPGFDAYLVKAVVHDWDDDTSVRILRNCRDAMPAHGACS
jgi:O-methyltransferase domain